MLVLLFIKYISDKYAGQPFAPIAIPAGASFKEMVERRTNLIAILNPALDFSKNRADGDDILGDAYEYLMHHFATESGKSKGQFYTPAEVSRIIAQILGIREAKTDPDTTAYDPACRSGSLLLKLADDAHEHDPARQPDGRYPVGQYAHLRTAAFIGQNMFF